MSLLSSSAFAANDTWTGKGGANWSVSANWLGGVAPVANDSLFFDGAVGVGLAPNNDFAANTAFGGITFNVGAAPFVLGGDVLNLAGNITNNNSLNAQIIGLPLALTGSSTVNVALRPGSLALTNTVSETSGTGFGLTKTGNGLLTLSASNVFTGPVVVTGGTLSVATDTSLGQAPGVVTAGNIVLNGGALRVTALGTINSNRSITLGGSGGTMDVSATVTNNGAISGSGNSFTKTGSGQLTLGGANSYTGNTIVNDGTLKLDFAQAGAPSANIINSSSPLVMSAVSTMLGTVNTAGLPTFNVGGSSFGDVSQTFNGVTFNNGSEIVGTTIVLNNVLLNLNGITRNTGGMVNFALGGTFVSGVNAIKTTTANDANGILGGWAAYNGTDYAANDGANNIIAYPSASYTSVALNAAIADAPTSNVRLNSGTGPATLAASGLTRINTLLQNLATAEIINIGGSQTLAFGAKGGVMIGSGKQAVTLGQTAGQGTITAGGGDGSTPGEINVLNFTANTVNFNSVIADNGSGAVKLSISQFGSSANNTVAINGAAGNTYSGGTIINSGRVQVNSSASAFGTGPVTILNNGQVFLSFAGTYTNNFNISGAAGAAGAPVGDTPSAIRLGANNTFLTGTITLLSDAAISPRNATGMRLQGQITGNYNFTIGDGTAGGQVILFNTANNWGGNLLINSQKIDLGASEVIPNGAGFGDVILNNNASAILDLFGNNETINGLSSQGPAAIVRDGGTLTLGDGNATATFSGTIQDGGDFGGALNIIKIGSGVQTFSGANTYSGTTIVSNGTLLVSAVRSAGGAVIVKEGATFGVTSPGATPLSVSSMTVGSSTGATLQLDLVSASVPVVAPGSLTINGTATINISSCPGITNAYPLVSGYSGGTVALGSQPPHLKGFVSASGGVVYYNLTNVDNDIWSAGNGYWDTSTANWINTHAGLYSQNDLVRFDDTPAGAGPFAVSNSIVVQPAGIYVTNSKSYSISGAAIAGAGGVTKEGSGSLTFSNVNTFTGPTTISGGQVVIGGAGQLGSGTYSALITDNGTLNYNSSAAQTLSGAISGTGAVTNNGPGTLTLSSGASTISGGVTLNAGTLGVGASSTGGAGAVTAGPLGTGTLVLNGGTLSSAGGADRTVNNDVNVNSGTTIVGAILSGGNPTLGGALSGAGTLANAATGNATTVKILGNLSGFTGTFNLTTYSTSNVRFGLASSVTVDASQAKFAVNQGTGSTRNVAFSDGFNSIVVKMGELSGNGVLEGSYNGGLNTFEIGALGTSTTFSGRLSDSTSGNQANFGITKVGTGMLTLSGSNSLFTGSMILSSGVVSLGNTNTSSTSGPLGAGPIKFTGGTLQYSLLNAADYSARIASSTSPISIDLNGANVTFATALPVSNTGGLALTNSTGSGKLTLTAGNLYTGNTCINAGTLALSGSGSIVSSSNIIVSSGATYDVSGVTGGSTLGSGQMLSGVGTVTGAVTSASIGSLISPATNGVVGTLTFNNDLNLNSGAIVYFDISTSHSSGNDQIVVGGNLTLSGFDVVHVHALSGAANLDQTADYVLFTVAGTITLNGSPSLVFDGTAPGNAINYSIRQSGNNVVLHFSSSIPPVVNSVVVTNTLDGSTIATHGQTVTVYATVTAGGATITNVSANLGAIGGSPSQVMNNLGGNNYSYTTTVGPSALVGGDLVTVTATDTTPLSGSGSATLTVNASTVTWDGLATDNNWGSATNWVGNNPPGYSGDNLIFNGSIRTTPNMDRNYAVAGLTFHAGPGSFTITNSPGTALTLNGTIENDCGLPQTLGVPVVLGALGTINDAGFGGITMGGSVSGLYGLIASNGVVTLSGSNSYAGDTTVSGTLMVGSSAAIPNGIGKGNVILDGTLDLNGTNAAVNGLNSAGTVDNTSAISASTLTIGNNNQSSSFSGVVQNSGGTNLALVKVGTGTLSLSGVNTYAGGTTLNGGLLLGNNTAFGTGTITLAGGTLENNGTVTLSNPINVQTNTTTIIDNGSAANFELDGNITGGGTITRGASQVQSLYLGGDNSGFTGTYQDQNNANSITRWTTPTSGSASARWIFNQAANLTRTGLQFTNVGATIYFGSIAGGGFLCENGAIFNSIIEVGALGLNDTFSGSFQSQGSYLAITKVGTGTWTLSGQSVYTGTNTLAGGVVSLGVTNNGATSGPLGSAAPIKFAGGTLQFSAANQNDYSSLIVNSTGPISIDVNGQNVTFATALGASNTGGLVLTNSTGTGTLTSSGANHYSGNTVINGGTLAISTLHASGGAFTVKDGAGLSVANAGGSSTVAMSSLAVGNGGATTLGFANVASTTTPLITSAGALTRNGTSAIVITGAGGLVANQTYPLITASGGIGGTGHFTLSLPVGVAGSLVTNGNTIALVIVPSVNTNPPPIIYSFDGTHLLLSWPTNSGWTLQMQTNSLSTGLGTNWVDLVPGSTGIISTNITVDQSNPAVFYRLKL